MRIIGGKDYYDSLAAYDTDSDRVFVRSRHSLDNAEKVPAFESIFRGFNIVQDGGWHRRNNFTINGEYHYFEEVHVVFAGQVYHGMLHRYWPTLHEPMEHSQRHTYWTREAAQAALAPLRLGFDVSRRWRFLQPDRADNYFDRQPLSAAAMEFVRQRGVLVAINVNYASWGDQWVINSDGLKEYHFASVMDPYTAYQELDMFAGTLLVNDNDSMVKLSDTQKAEKHGFDNKSFRNTHHRGKPRAAKGSL